MSNKAKKKNSVKRREQKRARKRVNYLRYGPKANHVGRRQKKSSQKKFRPKKTDGKEFNIYSFPGPKARKRKRMGLKTRGNTGFAKHPLRPLRKRRHLGAKEICERRTNPAILAGEENFR
jgi:hypothetical protein